MSEELPARDGFYMDREGGVWMRADANARYTSPVPGEGFDLDDDEEATELAQYGPFVRMVPLTEKQCAEIHDVADQITKTLFRHAQGVERWGATQEALTRELTEVDLWREIAEKTGDQ